jgi:parvulin-like peptidyl-prolyl isomerase
MTRLLSIPAVIALVALCGCGSEDIVSRCGDFELTVDDLRYEVSQLGPSYQYDGSLADRVKLVENITARHILADEAAALGFEESAEEAAADAESTAVGDAYVEWKLENSVRVPRISSLRWRDKLDRSLFIDDIVFRSRGLAEEAVGAVVGGAGYQDLMDAFSADEGVKFNEIGWRVWRDIDRGLTKHLYPLEVGQFSEVVSLPDGYHIFYLADARSLGVKDEVLFLRAKKFDRAVKEEILRRRIERDLIGRYDYRPDSHGIEAALEAFSLAFAGERPSPELLDAPVAEYDGGAVTVADLFTFYFDSPPESRFYAGDGFSIMKAAWDLAFPDICVKAGYDMNLDRLYKVRWTAARTRLDYLVPQMEDHMRSQITVSDADIRQYYDERKEDLVTPRTYVASRILLENREEVRQAMAELNAGADFGDVAREYSHDTYTAQKGGEMGPVNFGIIAVYDSIVGGLQPGQISRPFETRSGIEILKLDEVLGGEQLTFEEAVPYIEMFIRNQKANDMLADLVSRKKEELGFYLNEQLLARIWLPEPEYQESQARQSGD